jgi:hypothetical protein
MLRRTPAAGRPPGHLTGPQESRRPTHEGRTMIGRPRQFEDGTNRAALRRSRDALIERGGRIVQVRLEPEAVHALEQLRNAHGYSTDADAIGASLVHNLTSREK